MKEKEELVSVIITTHNRVDLLKCAIKSVLKQNYPQIELIVVNDNSTDETENYLNVLQKKYKNVLHLYIGPDETKGGNYARNKGISIANGNYIAFLDDDDEWLPIKIQKQMELIRKHPCFGMVYCEYYEEIDFKKRRLIKIDNSYSGDLSQLCFQKIFCTTSMILVKKEILIEAGMFDEELKFWQEYDLCIRIAEKTRIGYVDAPLMILRIVNSDSQRLSNKYEGWLKAVKIINNKYNQRILALPNMIKKNRKLMILREIAVRSNKAGKFEDKRQALFKIWKITNNPKHFIKYIFNISGFFG